MKNRLPLLFFRTRRQNIYICLAGFKKTQIFILSFVPTLGSLTHDKNVPFQWLNVSLPPLQKATQNFNCTLWKVCWPIFFISVSSSSLSAKRVVASTYLRLLRLLIFLLAIVIPACASSSLAFHMIYSAYKLNKQGDNIQPQHAPFPIWNQSVVPCPVLTVAS